MTSFWCHIGLRIWKCLWKDFIYVSATRVACEIGKHNEGNKLASRQPPKNTFSSAGAELVRTVTFHSLKGVLLHIHRLEEFSLLYWKNIYRLVTWTPPIYTEMLHIPVWPETKFTDVGKKHLGALENPKGN